MKNLKSICKLKELDWIFIPTLSKIESAGIINGFSKVLRGKNGLTSNCKGMG